MNHAAGPDPTKGSGLLHCREPRAGGAAANFLTRRAVLTHMHTFLFADGRVFDSRSGEVVCSGRVTRLEPQPAALLALLASRPGVLVTHDEIRRQLWADGRHVGYAASVHYAARQVRVALQDTAVSSRDVETIPRRGYRLRVGVLAGGVTPATHGVDARPGRPAAAVGRAQLAWVGAVCGLAALVALVEAGPNQHHQVAVALAGTLHRLVY